MTEVIPLLYYNKLPVGLKTLLRKDIKKWSVERLATLKVLEDALAQFNSTKQDRSDKIWQHLIDTLTEHEVTFMLQVLNLVKGEQLSNNDKKLLEKDKISHEILKLSLCDTDNHQEWFVNSETQLFQLKFQQSSQVYKLAFQQQYRDITNFEILESVGVKNYDWLTRDKVYYKVPIKLANNHFIRNSKFFPVKGFVFLSNDEMPVVYYNLFRKSVYHSFSLYGKHLHSVLSTLDCNDILKFIRSHLNVSVTSKYTVGQSLTRDNIELYLNRFPPCMYEMYGQLVNNRGLKHNARLQLVLFLKDAGMSADDVMAFMDSHYNESAEKQSVKWKKISYFIKHMMGLVGSKKPYEAFNCHQIIDRTQKVPNLDHGCPFYKRKYPGITSIQPAYTEIQDECSNCFRGKFQSAQDDKTDDDEVIITHPNQYFEQAVKCFATKEAVILDIEDLL